MEYRILSSNRGMLEAVGTLGTNLIQPVDAGGLQSGQVSGGNKADDGS